MRRKRRVRKASLDEEQHYPKPLDHTIRNYGQDEMPREFANSELSLRTEITRAHDVRHSYHVDDVTAQACGGSTEITTSFRSNPSEFFNSANQKSGISVACCENDSMGDSECIDFKEHITSEACVGQPDLCVQMQIFDNDDKLCDNVRLKLGDSTGTSCLSSASFQKEILGVDDCVYKNAQDGKTLIPKLSKTPSTNVGVMEPTSDSTILQFENRGRGQHGKATDLSVPISSVSSTIDFGTNPMELIGMTFHRKPPMVDLNNIQRILLEGGGSYGGISVLYILGLLFKIENVISAEDCPRSCFPLAVFVTCDFMKAPLFVDEEPVTEVRFDIKKTQPAGFSEKCVGGFGLQPSFGFVGKLKVKKVEELLAYQNFTLEDSVSRWLLHVDSGDSGQNSNAAAMEPSSPTGSSSSQIDSQGSWVESCGKRVTEPGSVSVKSPILGKLKQQICGDLNVEMNPFVKEVTGEQAHGDLNGAYRSESDSTKGKECSDCLLDMSQISGPDGKSKPTPVSQIGFRDPASFGGGQQLTLLSVEVRKGILPRLLEEILSTRIMVKQAMKKLAPSQQVLHRIFNARQLALKLIVHVTYGYTAARFSGRVPCAELADSIVQCGRRTLENAISFVNSHDRWNAKVVYGDRDSMFVLLRGRTVEESFEIGHEIASAVTAANPNPVTLKMEKVYHS
ncbi:hypothetical protein RHGRI_021326 [Rhododendron griersonianum]|uniref:DNA polymerase zeta catalytic subunit n=1 Tax=Rhododendron griersonianum TaxID=479676 RepID=A0AAV6JN53_9ERIC|nr:hypothetical protein RHGRI_021326 [Rhododendron griersonianum]